MKVYVWVRFSIRMGSWMQKVDLREDERPAWFRFRADMFNRGLLPCLMRQTLPPEKVLVLIDRQDRALFDACIDTAGGLVEPMCVTPQELHAALARRLATPDDAVLACRIDSDDLVADDYLAGLAGSVAAAAPEGPLFCIAANGHVSDLRSIQPYRFETSPFFAAYFPPGSPMRSFGKRHMDLGSEGPVLLDEAARWMQLIHPSNVSNRMLWTEGAAVSDATWPASFYRPPPDLFALHDWRKPGLRLQRLRYVKRRLVNAVLSRLGRSKGAGGA